MTRDELIKKIAEDAEITKAATNALNSVLEGITEALQANSSITLLDLEPLKLQKEKLAKALIHVENKLIYQLAMFQLSKLAASSKKL